MLNIEIVKFEAQDIITVSAGAGAGAGAPDVPQEPIVPDLPADDGNTEKCICADNCVKVGNIHYRLNPDGGRTNCTGINFNYQHDCTP